RELARGEEDLLGEGGPDDVDELLDAAVAVAEAEPGGRNCEHRVGGADAQVGRERDGKPAADADAAYHGDGGLERGIERGVGGIPGLVVDLDGIGTAALLLELGDVGA